MNKTAFDMVKNLDLNGKVFLVTGAYSGLGAETTKSLLTANATVILAGRNPKAQADFAQELIENDELDFEENQLDASHTIELGDLTSVRNFAQYVASTYDTIHCLINNAGVMNTPPGITKDGFEIQMGINVVGHFLLSKILAEKTERQIWLSSSGHTRFGAPRIDLEAITQVDEKTYIPRARYQQSKLGNILLAKQFGVEYPHMLSVAVHPGVVRTNLARNMSFLQKMQLVLAHPRLIMSMKDVDEGASTQVMVATIPESELVNGAYYADRKIIEEAESAKNMEDAKRLFDYCDEVTKSFQV